MLGLVSVPVIRLTSAPPYARGVAASTCCMSSAKLEAEPPCASPQAIMIAPARMLSCLLMPSARIWAQSNPLGTSGSKELVIMRAFCCACAENAPIPTSARKTPARTVNRPIKTRRLKNADCEVDFFFIDEFRLTCLEFRLKFRFLSPLRLDRYRDSQTLLGIFLRNGPNE